MGNSNNVRLSREGPLALLERVSVPFDQIAKSLEKIRREAAQLDQEEERKVTGRSAPRFRATLSNLIFLWTDCGKMVDEKVLDSLISELCVNHPSRFFIVQYSAFGAACSGLAQVYSRCVMANSGVHVCSEEVYISVQPNTLPGVSSLLLSLLLPDIDLVLSVFCDPVLPGKSEQVDLARDRFLRLFRSLRQISNVIVYDSAAFENYDASLCELLGETHLSARERERVRHRDVNWTRTKRWRSLITEQFDAPRFANAAPNISQITFYCRVKQEELRRGLIPAQALLISGWLLASLGYSAIELLDELDLARLSFRAMPKGVSSRASTVAFVSESEPCFNEKGDLNSIEMHLESSEERLRLTLKRMREKQLAVVAADVLESAEYPQDSCEVEIRSTPFPEPAIENLVAETVGMQGEDQGYLAAMEWGRRIVRVIQQSERARG